MSTSFRLRRTDVSNRREIASQSSIIRGQVADLYIVQRYFDSENGVGDLIKKYTIGYNA